MGKRSRRAAARRPESGGGSAARQRAERARVKASGPSPLSRLRPFILPAILAAAGLAVVWIGVFGSTETGVREQPPPVLGDAAAPVTMVEYGDFQCPSCGAFFRSIEPQLRAEYIDTGRVRLEWHDFAWIGPESRDAANAARCAADQGRFWEYHDLLYRNQAGENTGTFSKDRLKLLGVSAGLETAPFERCVDDGTFAGTVAADTAEVRSLGLRGTPTFIIGGQQIVGAQPIETFRAALDAALAAAGG